MKKTLEDFSLQKIKKTKLIYQYDPLNKNNFHNYIDNHPHILALARLTNGRIVAAYSEDPISHGGGASSGAMVMSVTEKKAFKLMSEKRPVTYDTFFAIFGNSEFRLKTGELRFYTNFGIGNCFFDAQGFKYTVLTGDAPRDTELTTFEFFEVIFE